MTFKKTVPDITVIVPTYCHEGYISQALDSILDQETDLQYEVLVGDDASTDRTLSIVQEYAKRYPDIIIPKRKCWRNKKQLGYAYAGTREIYRFAGGR